MGEILQLTVGQNDVCEAEIPRDMLHSWLL